jgi:small conductance mechanosensitive channel
LWAWHLVLEVNILSEILFLVFIILENQYRIGDVVKFDNAGGTVEEISLRKNNFKRPRRNRAPHSTWRNKKVSNFSKDFSRINLDIGVGYGSNLEHVIGVINKVGLNWPLILYGKITLFFLLNFARQ